MSGTDALSSDAPSPARPLFVGRRGGQAVTFVCSHDGSFGIWCGGACLSVWAADRLDIALRAFLDAIERCGGTCQQPPATVNCPGHDAPPQPLWNDS